MEPPTFDELVEYVRITPDLLDEKCSDAHIASISQFLDWRTVAPHLGLDKTDISDIDSKKTEPEKRVETLQKWRKNLGFRATLKVLVEVLLATRNADDAETVCRLLQQHVPKAPSQASGQSSTATAKAASTNKVAGKIHGKRPKQRTPKESPLIRTLVTKQALPRLQNLLSPVVASWGLFAQQIGVPTDKTDQIKAANAQIGPNWLSTCFTEALEWWVDNHRGPTYEVILAVLDPKEGEMNPAMNRALARKVRHFMAREGALH